MMMMFITIFAADQRLNSEPRQASAHCNHRRYIPHLLDITQSGKVEPSKVLSKYEEFDDAIEAYRQFDNREPGWLKVELRVPAGKA